MIERIPRNVIRDISQPVVRTIDPIPVTQYAPPPVVRGIQPPVINVPEVEIDYPTIDVPTEQDWRGVMGGEEQSEPIQETPGRDLPESPAIPTQPTIDIGGNEIPIPEAAPLITAGASAIVATTVTLGATIAFQQVKSAAEPLVKQLLAKKKKKIKIKQVKPVLHFIPNEDGSTELIQYSQKGMKILESNIDKLEQFLRDEVDLNSLYEYDNKLIIDEELKNSFTKAGQKRFKRHFAAPKVIAKKLGSKFAF